jgi:Fur family transcriptional regulator, peroxide stress response regulator
MNINLKFRQTKKRELIFLILTGTREHPTADWIYEEARKKIPNISKGTIYRNLAILVKTGAISELNLNGTITRYEIKQTQHYHFRCEKCGRVFDINGPISKELDGNVAEKTGFKIKYHRLEFHGLCKDCQ